MKQWILVLLGTVAVLCVGSCVGQYSFGVYVATDGSSKTHASSGIILLDHDGAPLFIPDTTILELVQEDYGTIPLQYQSVTKVGTNVDRVEYRVDGELAATTGVMQTYPMHNWGNGMHEIRMLVYRRNKGDNSSAGVETHWFYAHTYARNTKSGLRRIQHDGATYSIIPRGATIDLPNSAGPLVLVYSADAASTWGRFITGIDWYLGGNFIRRTAPGESMTYWNGQNGFHDAKAVVFYLRTGDQAPAGMDTLNFIINMRVDWYPD